MISEGAQWYIIGTKTRKMNIGQLQSFFCFSPKRKGWRNQSQVESPKSSKDEDENRSITFLTTKEKRSLAKSWGKIAPNKKVFGQKIYLQIFVLKPELQDLFPFSGLRPDQLTQNMLFIRQAAIFSHFLQVRAYWL